MNASIDVKSAASLVITHWGDWVRDGECSLAGFEEFLLAAGFLGWIS